jgi:hypothetical protein
MVPRDVIRLIARFLLLAALFGSLSAAHSSGGQAYVTWNVFEPDKCASIWLIKRFVASDADFLFFDPESDPPKGILFDTPNALFTRSHNKSTFESLVDHHRISDASVAYIGRLMHDIEINTWRRKVLPESRAIESELNQALLDRAPGEAVERCLNYFDELAGNHIAPNSVAHCNLCHSGDLMVKVSRLVKQGPLSSSWLVRWRTPLARPVSSNPVQLD